MIPFWYRKQKLTCMFVWAVSSYVYLKRVGMGQGLEGRLTRLPCYKEHMLPCFKLNFWFWDNCRFTCSSHEIICRGILCALSFPCPPVVTLYTSIALDHEDITADSQDTSQDPEHHRKDRSPGALLYRRSHPPSHTEPTQQWIHFQ